METHAIDVDGLPLRWEERGGGLPVVLLHGLPTGPALWRHAAPRLAGCRVLVPEMVGYGGSLAEGYRRDLSLAHQAEVLARWMATLRLPPAVLAGHDLGGGVAQIVAVRHREQVAGLVLVDAVAYDAWPIPAVRVLRALGGLLTLCPAEVLYPVFALLMLRGHADLDAAREALRLHLAPYLTAPDGAAAFVRQIEALDARDTLAVAERLRGLGLPARVAWGTADPFLPIGLGARLAADLGAPLMRIEGGRHFVPEDQPEHVAAAIQAVVEEARGDA